MKIPTFVTAVLLTALGGLAACMPCPGGIVIGPNADPNEAMNAAVACDGQSRAAANSAPSSGSKTGEEMRAFNQCFQNHGYLTIPESVLLDKGPSKDGALCPACVKKQLAAQHD